MSQSPNLLFVFSDQHRARDLGCYGNPQVHSPHLDAFAQNAARFANCIANCPVCVPSRGTLLTSLYPWNHGALTNDLPVRRHLASIAHVLNEAGYHTGYIGKWHLGGIPRDKPIPAPERLGFQTWKVANCNHRYDRAYYFDEHDQRHDSDLFESEMQTNLAIDFIRQHADSTQPWSLHLSWGPPHDPYHTVPQRYLDRFAQIDIDLPPNVPQEILTRLGKPKATRADALHWLRGYYAQISFLDDAFSRLLAALRETGQLENTIIVYTSDHGDQLGSQGLKNKQLPFEESIHVPLLVSGPGIPAGSRQQLIGLLDLAPSLLGLLGLSFSSPIDGSDFSAALLSPHAPTQDACLIADLVPCHQAADRGGREWVGVRTASATYSRYGDGTPWICYDNAVDPHQQNNLVAGNPQHPLIASLDLQTSQRLAQANHAFRPRHQMLIEDGYLDAWNESQAYFNRPLLQPSDPNPRP